MNLSTVLLLAIANYTPGPLTRCDCPKCREQAKLFVDSVRPPQVADVATNGAQREGPQARVVAEVPLQIGGRSDAEAESPAINANICLHMAKRNPSLAAETRKHYQQTISRECEKHRISPALIAALISMESSFNAEARSPSGALGLGQLMPQTLADLGVSDPFDPEQSIRACAQLMARHRDKWKEHPERNRLAVASYRLGYGAVVAAGGVPDSPSVVEFIDNVLSLAAQLGMDAQRDGPANR